MFKVVHVFACVCVFWYQSRLFSTNIVKNLHICSCEEWSHFYISIGVKKQSYCVVKWLHLFSETLTPEWNGCTGPEHLYLQYQPRPASWGVCSTMDCHWVTRWIYQPPTTFVSYIINVVTVVAHGPRPLETWMQLLVIGSCLLPGWALAIVAVCGVNSLNGRSLFFSISLSFIFPLL